MIASISIPAPIVAFGLVTGATYGILAVGLVLVYRMSRIINFAHGEIGAFGAAVLGVLVVNTGVPYWVAFPFCILLSAAVAAGVEAAVVRRLRNAPKLMSVIATLGFAQFLVSFELVVNAQARAGRLYPQPPGLPSFNIGVFPLSPARTGMLIFTPLLAVALALFLRHTRVGVAMRAAAANGEAARLAAIPTLRMSTLAWALAGGLSAFGAILTFPTVTQVSSGAFGPGLLVRAIAAAAIGRMSNMPVAFAAGLGIGLFEEIASYNTQSGGVVELGLFVLILVTFLVLPARSGRAEDKGSVWATVQGLRGLSAELRRRPLVRYAGWVVAAIAIAIAAMLPLFISSSSAFALSEVFALAIVGLSLAVITGLLGQLSLGQAAIAGIGAFASYRIAAWSGNYVLAIAAGGAAGALASIIVGVPALRIKGLMLGVATLSLALMAPAWLFQQSWFFGSGVSPGEPVIGTFSFASSKAYYFFALFFLVLSFWLAYQIRSGGLGRLLTALRDNEDGARSFTVGAVTRKLQAFALAGFLAGIGGAVFAHALARIDAGTYPTSMSIDSVAALAIGGVGLLAGPIIGAAYVFGIPALVPLDAAGLAATAGGWLILVLYVPGGLASLIRPLRDRLFALAGSPAAATIDEPPVARLAAVRSAVVEPVAHKVRDTGVLLSATNLSKRYGGVHAVDEVSLDVMAGETLGLIGPNGAGKTTLFELLSGFTRPDGGEITFAGQPIARAWLTWRGRTIMRRDLGPERRGRLGLARSFQDAALFPTMTVQETLMVALEKELPTPMLGSVVGFREVERPKRARAEELVTLLGLDAYRDKPVGELSTGTRRIAELACMLALEPRLLLLDEPSSGVAQRETERLGDLLRHVKDRLGTTLVVIEHDIPLIMSLSDRVIAMEAGRIIATGSPRDVRENPRVVESYLGGDVAAIERSTVQISVPVAARQ